ncbi:MAG: hypothetical protein P4L28_00730 [Paludibacteraceae bacterium]|nr:hypothetical protein [Paludibacteraceae bacterium]
MIIAVDFDGTIVEHAYPEIGKDIPFAIETLKMLQQDQHLLILWTVREGELLDEAVKYCKDKGLLFYAINSNMPDRVDERFSTRKVSVDLFIDDRNLGGLPEWGVIYQMIKNNKAFEPYSYEIENEYTKKTKKSVINKILGR